MLDLDWRFNLLDRVCEVLVEGGNVNVGPYVSDGTSNRLRRSHIRQGQNARGWSGCEMGGQVGDGSGQVGSRSDTDMDRSEALDAGIRSTDGFAAHARVSTLRKGYIQDEFLQFMVPRHKTLPTHAPLIHIGTYHRSGSIDRLVHVFLEAGGRSKKQVVSLGAGSDTRFWRLAVRED